MNIRRTRSQPWLLVSILALGLLIAFEKHGTTSIIQFIITPVLRCANAVTVPIKRMIISLHSWSYLRQRCVHLELENDNLVNENVTLRSVVNVQENSRLLTAFENRYRHAPHCMVRILSVDHSPTGHYCIVDKGSDDGIEEEMCAVHKTQLIGKVVRVYKTHSKVMLITDKNCKVSVFVAGSNQHGICEGSADANLCRIRFIKEPQALTIGSMVITNGKGVVFHEGFLVGFLTRVMPNAPDAPGEWLIEVAPRLSVDSMEFCHLIPHRQAKES